MLNQKIVCIIQARMNSSRLPGKVMLSLKGKPALQRLIERVKLSLYINEVVVALPHGVINTPIVSVCSDTDTMPFYGPEEDVMQRVLMAAEFTKADIIVDVTGDCPFVDPRHIDYLLEILLAKNLDYAGNVFPRSWPDGLDVQCYYMDALKKVRDKHNPSHHVGWNITQYPYDFKIFNWMAKGDNYNPSLRLTLDTIEDYVLLSNLAETVSWPDFKVEDVIKFLKFNPHLTRINENVKTKSIEEG